MVMDVNNGPITQRASWVGLKSTTLGEVSPVTTTLLKTTCLRQPASPSDSAQSPLRNTSTSKQRAVNRDSPSATRRSITRRFGTVSKSRSAIPHTLPIPMMLLHLPPRPALPATTVFLPQPSITPMAPLLPARPMNTTKLRTMRAYRARIPETPGTSRLRTTSASPESAVLTARSVMHKIPA